MINEAVGAAIKSPASARLMVICEGPFIRNDNPEEEIVLTGKSGSQSSRDQIAFQSTCQTFVSRVPCDAIRQEFSQIAHVVLGENRQNEKIVCVVEPEGNIWFETCTDGSRGVFDNSRRFSIISDRVRNEGNTVQLLGDFTCPKNEKVRSLQFCEGIFSKFSLLGSGLGSFIASTKQLGSDVFQRVSEIRDEGGRYRGDNNVILLKQREERNRDAVGGAILLTALIILLAIHLGGGGKKR